MAATSVGDEGSRTCYEEGRGERTPETATPQARPAVKRRAWSPSEPETSELREAMCQHSKMERWSPSSGGVESLGADCGSGGGWVCVLLHLCNHCVVAGVLKKKCCEG